MHVGWCESTFGIYSSNRHWGKKIKKRLAANLSHIDWAMSKSGNRDTEADKQSDCNIDRSTLIIVESPPSKCSLLERACGKLLSRQALTQVSCVSCVCAWRQSNLLSHRKALMEKLKMDFLTLVQADKLLIFFTQTEVSPCVLFCTEKWYRLQQQFFIIWLLFSQ